MPQTEIAVSEYTALLTQAGTAAPTAQILTNLGFETITWSRVTAGVYKGETTTPLDRDKCAVYITNINNDSICSGIVNIDGDIQIATCTAAGTPTDAKLSKTTFKIQIYND